MSGYRALEVDCSQGGGVNQCGSTLCCRALLSDSACGSKGPLSRALTSCKSQRRHGLPAANEMSALFLKSDLPQRISSKRN
jgi:hypothetical protein